MEVGAAEGVIWSLVFLGGPPQMTWGVDSWTDGKTSMESRLLRQLPVFPISGRSLFCVSSLYVPVDLLSCFSRIEYDESMGCLFND